MQTEQLEMSEEQAQKISNMLQSQGLSQSEIDVILNGEYSSFQTDMDLTDIFSSSGNHQNILRGLADGYSIEELKQNGVSSKEIEKFTNTLEKYNLTVENAKAINKYSNGSNMILAIKRETADRSAIQDGIRADMMGKLQTRGLSQEQISNLESYIGNLDFSKPVHENYDIISQYMKEIDIPHNCYSSVCAAVKDMDSLEHIDDTLANLDEGLSKSRLPQSMKLYRAIKTNGDINPKGYVGKNINNKGYTSTSPLYESSFAKYDDYDTVMEIYAPKGTQGSYMTQLSDYDNAEQEVLLNPNDIYIVDAQEGVIDQNGRNKTVLKGLLLSKERECYRGIDIDKKESPMIDNGQQQFENSETNLPAKQNRFSRFFSQMRSRFNRQNSQNYQEQSSSSKQNKTSEVRTHEKKTWELDPEEKARIQIETAKIAEKHRGQQEMDSLQQEEYQNSQNIAQPIQEQASIDMGGMEL